MSYNHTPTTQVRPQAPDRRARALAISQAALDRLQVALQRGLSMYRHLPLLTNTSQAAARASAASAADLMAGDWKARSVAAYRQAQSQEIATLPGELALRVHSLTGRTIAAESIFVDSEAQMASAVVDGAVFRLRDGQLVLVRPYAECGNHHLESAPLATQADLGYVLSAWQPLCPGSQPDDPANWLDYQSL
jgi:hypothetical protein